MHFGTPTKVCPGIALYCQHFTECLHSNDRYIRIFLLSPQYNPGSLNANQQNPCQWMFHLVRVIMVIFSIPAGNLFR